VIAEGLSPQLLSFGNDYIRKSLEQEDATALQNFKSQAKTVTADANALDSLKGVLATAKSNGYKTGLVTSSDVTKVAPQFYGISAEGDVASALIKAPFDYIAGGGRSHFLPKATAGSTRTDTKDLAKELKIADGTAYFDVESLDEDSKGKVLSLHSNGNLSYTTDVEQETESGFSDLVAQGLTTLSEGNAPFVLVVHDEFLSRALKAKDTPGLAESYHQLDTLTDDLLTRATDSKGEFGVAVLATAATSAPVVTATTPTDISGTFFIISNLSRSYTGAGAKLKGATVEQITEFATDTYKGWKVSASDKAAIAAGTLNPETAIRASYEPAIAISYKEVTPESALHLLNLPDAESGVASITKVVDTAPLASTLPVESELDAE
jgi:hypothetical protein